MFIVFYNGSEPQPERREYRLSDSYARKDGDICLELVVLQININSGYNETLMSDCHILLGIEQGLTQGKTETAKRLIQLGKNSIEDISAATELSVEQVRHLAQTMSCLPAKGEEITFF